MTKHFRIAIIAVALAAPVGCDAYHSYFHREAAPDQLAVYEIAKLRVAEQNFYSAYHKYGNLLELRSHEVNLMPHSVTDGVYSGYRFSLLADASGYSLSAVPERRDAGIRRSFYCDQTGVIRQSQGPQNATAQSEIVR